MAREQIATAQRSGPNGQTLHQRLKDQLLEALFRGKHPDGGLLPPERDLAALHRVSRITVRTTLAALEQEGLLERRQGHGTRVRLLRVGTPTALDLLAVLAPVQNPFFSSFLQNLEAAAEEEGALVVVKQVSRGSLEEVLFSLYRRGIRNAVVWPYDVGLDELQLARLRGLGMNLVLFDHVLESAAADSIGLDHRHAIQALHGWLKGTGAKNLAYLGWEGALPSSNREREEAFVALEGAARVRRLPWKQEREVEAALKFALTELPEGCDGLLCGNGVIGNAARALAPEPLRVATVDDLPGAEGLGLTAYAQPMRELALAAWKRLVEQNRKPQDWRPQVLRLRGRLIERKGPAR